jgi:hypothetical protein
MPALVCLPGGVGPGPCARAMRWMRLEANILSNETAKVMFSWPIRTSCPPRKRDAMQAAAQDVTTMVGVKNAFQKQEEEAKAARVQWQPSIGDYRAATGHVSGTGIGPSVGPAPGGYANGMHRTDCADHRPALSITSHHP